MSFLKIRFENIAFRYGLVDKISNDVDVTPWNEIIDSTIETISEIWCYLIINLNKFACFINI